jgi:hypothetical protein
MSAAAAVSPAPTVANSSRFTPLESQFLHWLLVDPEHGVIRFATEKERPAIEAVATLHERSLQGNVVLDKEWDAAWAAAWAAQRQKLVSLGATHKQIAEMLD